MFKILDKYKHKCDSPL